MYVFEQHASIKGTMRFCLFNNKYSPPLTDGATKIGNAFTRFLGRFLCWVTGWRFVGEFPDDKQVIAAAGPHTSNWDFVVSMLLVLESGVRISFLMKKEAFFWPLRNLFIWLGGVPLDRDAPDDIVDQISEYFETNEKLWLVITPEGTRSKVDRWKTGFLRIAEKVNVPVCLVAWDYPSKTMYLLKEWPLTGSHEDDAEAIRQYICENYQGRYPDKQ